MPVFEINDSKAVVAANRSWDVSTSIVITIGAVDNVLEVFVIVRDKVGSGNERMSAILSTSALGSAKNAHVGCVSS